jgi:glycosyltransferase involved in cell wall biosynthesis
MKISIVTPSYNGAAYLDRTAQSILTQTGDVALEWLVVDGGSTDGTLDYLRSIKDERLKWISEPDRGQSHAVNRGLGLATGDIIGWLNTDDLYTPGALQAVASAFEQSCRVGTAHLPEQQVGNAHPTDFPQASWLIGRCEVIDAADQPIRESVTRYKDRALRRYSRRALLRENFISQPAVFWRRDFGNTIGPLDESLHWTMDYDLWLRMASRAEPLFLDQVIARFRLHAASKTGQVSRKQFDEQYAVASRYFGPDRISRLVHRFNVEKIVWAYRVMRLLGI